MGVNMMKAKVNNVSFDSLCSIILIICGLLLTGLFIFVKSHVYILAISVACIAAGLCYILLIKRNLKIEYINSLNILRYNYILIMVTFLISIYTSYLTEYRTIAYFISISLCASFTALLTLHNIESRHNLLILFIIILISLNVRYFLFFKYDGMLGIDSKNNALILESMLGQGFVGSNLLGKYNMYNLMYVVNYAFSILTTINLKTTVFLSLTIPLTLSSLVIYYIGKKRYSDQIGLIATMFYNVGDFSISSGTQYLGWSYGIIFYIFILYFMLKNKNQFKFTPLIPLFIAIIFTHPITVFISFVMLCVIFIYNIIDHKKILTILVFDLLMVVSWAFITYIDLRGINSTLLKTVLESIYISFFMNSPLGYLNVTTISSFEFIVLFYSTIGFLISIFLGFIGFLSIAKHYNSFNDNLDVLLITAIMLGVPFIFSFFGFRTVMNYRWFSYGYVTLALLSGVGISKLININIKINLKIFIYLILTFSLTFGMITNKYSNEDSPLFPFGSDLRTSFTFQEISPGFYLIKYHNDSFVADGWLVQSMIISAKPDVSFHSYLSTYSFEDYVSHKITDEPFLWRWDYASRPTMMTFVETSIQQIMGTTFRKAIHNKYNLVFHNSKIDIYLR
jgi:hypothetical protein